MIVLEAYVRTLCFALAPFQELPALAELVLQFVAGGYVVPTALALVILFSWFEGETAADRLANQQTVLRGLMTTLAAWGLAALCGSILRHALSSPELQQTAGLWACWQGPPAPSAAAAVGFALGATVWRQDWRRGLGIFLITGLWAIAQVCCGFHYPLDVVAGATIGTALGWLLGAAGWLNRPLDALIRLARRLMLA